MDPLQWMGAIRMRVQTDVKNITIIPSTPVHQLTSFESTRCVFVKNKNQIIDWSFLYGWTIPLHVKEQFRLLTVIMNFQNFYQKYCQNNKYLTLLLNTYKWINNYKT